MGAPDEALARFRQPGGLRGLLGPRLIPRRLISTGRAWRLGVLLIDASGRLYSTGEVTRAIEPLRGVANKSPDAELRRDNRRLAVRSGFPIGEVVNFGYELVEFGASGALAGGAGAGDALAGGADAGDAAARTHAGPLSLRAGVIMVRWSVADADVMSLSDYFADRIALLRGG